MKNLLLIITISLLALPIASQTDDDCLCQLPEEGFNGTYKYSTDGPIYIDTCTVEANDTCDLFYYDGELFYKDFSIYGYSYETFMLSQSDTGIIELKDYPDEEIKSKLIELDKIYDILEIDFFMFDTTKHSNIIRVLEISINSPIVIDTADKLFTEIFNSVNIYTKSQVVIPHTGINQLKIVNEQFDIFPNPTSDLIHIISDKNMLESVSLYNINGKKISKSHNINKKNHSIDVKNSDDGMYFLIINEKYFKKVFVK